jgi:hypothetical protein
MTSFRIFAVSLSSALLAAPLLCGGDLSRYRSFQFGADLPTIAGQARMDPSEAKVVHRLPALIQELEWRPQPLGPSTRVESADKVVFSFYNGELYRIVVNYDRYNTEGLTAEDLIEAISATYGTATTNAAGITLQSIYDANENVKVIACWEDSKYSMNLVRSSYQPTFALVAFSKRLDSLAGVAVAEAVRLEKEQAPQREIERQEKQAEENRVLQEKARLANKPGFRP